MRHAHESPQSVSTTTKKEEKKIFQTQKEVDLQPLTLAFVFAKTVGFAAFHALKTGFSHSQKQQDLQSFLLSKQVFHILKTSRKLLSFAPLKQAFTQ